MTKDEQIERLTRKQWPLHPDDDRNSLVNPDGPAAAEAIKALQAEVERLFAVGLELAERTKTAEAKAEALQAEVERLGEERDELGIAASHWEERAEAAEAEAEALQAEVERLIKQGRELYDSRQEAWSRAAKSAGEKLAAEAEAEALQAEVERLKDLVFKTARQLNEAENRALAAGEEQP